MLQTPVPIAKGSAAPAKSGERGAGRSQTNLSWFLVVIKRTRKERN